MSWYEATCHECGRKRGDGRSYDSNWSRGWCSIEYDDRIDHKRNGRFHLCGDCYETARERLDLCRCCLYCRTKAPLKGDPNFGDLDEEYWIR